MKSTIVSDTIISTTLLTVIILFSQVASAGTNSAGIDNRQHHQSKRIIQGINSGELNAKETVKLSAQQARIRHQERRFKSDGHFTLRERARIHNRQRHASRNIHRKKHN